MSAFHAIFRSQPAGAEGGLEVVAPDRSVQIEHFADDIQVRHQLALHAARVDFAQVDSARRDLRLCKSAAVLEWNLEGLQCAGQSSADRIFRVRLPSDPGKFDVAGAPCRSIAGEGSPGRCGLPIDCQIVGIDAEADPRAHPSGRSGSKSQTRVKREGSENAVTVRETSSTAGPETPKCVNSIDPRRSSRLARRIPASERRDLSKEGTAVTRHDTDRDIRKRDTAQLTHPGSRRCQRNQGGSRRDNRMAERSPASDTHRRLCHIPGTSILRWRRSNVRQ